MAQNISVPDIGDFENVEVIEVLIKPGDQVNKNDPIVTIESDKSSVEIPSPSAGEIKDLKVKVGDKVSEGSLLATIENGQTAQVTKQAKKITQEQLKEYFSNHRVGSSPDYAVVKNGDDYLFTVHGYGDDKTVCEEVIKPYNENPNLSIVKGTYECVRLND